MKRLYIWGWWQGNNLGDNWIKKVLSDIFPEAEFLDTSVQRFAKNSFVICGGGGLFIYDVISPWDNVQSNIEYGILGLGAEFPHESMNAVNLYKGSRFFYVRDQYSLDCMHIEKADRSYDLTFAMPLRFGNTDEVSDRKVFFVWRDGQELLDNDKFRDYIKAYDNSAYQIWKSKLNLFFDEIKEDDFQTDENNIEERISDCGFVVSGRYHGIVAAIQKGIPFIAIDICPKIRALLEECGLDEYCIKISETDKIESLILKARKDTGKIRDMEHRYAETAHAALSKHILNAKLEILKVLRPLRIIHYGSYWMKENDLVNTMSDDLQELCRLKKIDLRSYGKHPSRRIASSIDTPNGKQCRLSTRMILKDVKRNRADAVILNSGGLHLEDVAYSRLKKNNVITVGISLSDPDVFPYNGKLYADKFALFYTNSRYSLLNEYPATGANIRIMPFAASVKHHYYMPEVERRYDIVVVAHARKERLEVIRRLETLCNVGTYGSGWPHSLGTVNGREHVRAINSGKMYVSFSRTVAGFDNVKVGLFEAMACNQVVITSYMDELQDYFEVGKEILCYRSEDELYDIVKYYLEHVDEREAVREKGYKRFLNDHTYEKRWNNVLMDTYKIKGLL